MQFLVESDNSYLSKDASEFLKNTGLSIDVFPEIYAGGWFYNAIFVDCDGDRVFVNDVDPASLIEDYIVYDVDLERWYEKNEDKYNHKYDRNYKFKTSKLAR